MKPYEEHMTSCPKCGSGDVANPLYVPPSREYLGGGQYNTGKGYLSWECRRCHYSEATATRDAPATSKETP